MTEHTEEEELGNVERGFIISVWVIGIALLTGLLLNGLGYPWAMRRVAEFVGLYATLAAGVWVVYILYDLRDVIGSSGEKQSTLTDWDDSREKQP